MSHHKSAFILVALLLAVLSLSAAAVAPALKFTFKDVNAPGATETDPYAINNEGVIAGDYVDTNGAQHAMVLAGKKLTTVDRKDCPSTPSSTGLAFHGINSSSVAAGWCTEMHGVEIGFTWAKGKFTDITISGAILVNANGINDKGAVVGTYMEHNGAQHGFLLVGKKLTKLDPPGMIYSSTAYGINNTGVITVFGVNSSGTMVSFTTANNGKTYKPFRAPKQGSAGTVIHAINNNGDIVGTYADSSGIPHGVLFHGGKYYSFDDPKGVNSTRADGVNDTLGIVGRYSPTSQTNQGYFAQAK